MPIIYVERGTRVMVQHMALEPDNFKFAERNRHYVGKAAQQGGYVYFLENRMYYKVREQDVEIPAQQNDINGDIY